MRDEGERLRRVSAFPAITPGGRACFCAICKRLVELSSTTAPPLLPIVPVRSIASHL